MMSNTLPIASMEATSTSYLSSAAFLDIQIGTTRNELIVDVDAEMIDQTIERNRKVCCHRRWLHVLKSSRGVKTF